MVQTSDSWPPHAQGHKVHMKTGELAQRAGVSIDTVRYYERQGLLPEPARQASGYRSYVSGDVGRLQFVRRAKALGFTLEEIRDLLALSGRRDDDMGGLKTRSEEHTSELQSLMRISYAVFCL